MIIIFRYYITLY